MKKNKMMRLASGLLVAVLLTTSMISGTFAKYVTSADATDEARVAEWGIQMSNEGSDVFTDTYGATVDSNNEDDVVAPGTANSKKYTITGTPETAYEISFNGAMVSEVYLGAGSYTYPEPYVNMDVTIAENYYPIEYTVDVATTAGTVTGTLADSYETLKDAMDALNAVKVRFDPNEECDVVATIGWEWPFYVDTTADKCDTALGDLAARNPDLTATGTSSLEVKYTLVITATQID